MIRAFFVEFIFPLLLLLFLRSILRNVLQAFRGKTPARSESPYSPRQTTPVPAGGELKKDPVCGTYVSTAACLTRNVGGQVMYFCSAECRDKFKVA